MTLRAESVSRELVPDPFDLDALEARAAEAVEFVYGPMLDRVARLWAQKGIEGMRLAVAEAKERTGC